LSRGAARVRVCLHHVNTVLTLPRPARYRRIDLCDPGGETAQSRNRAGDALGGLFEDATLGGARRARRRGAIAAPAGPKPSPQCRMSARCGVSRAWKSSRSLPRRSLIRTLAPNPHSRSPVKGCIALRRLGGRRKTSLEARPLCKTDAPFVGRTSGRTAKSVPNPRLFKSSRPVSKIQTPLDGELKFQTLNLRLLRQLLLRNRNFDGSLQVRNVPSTPWRASP
jgi:hypothetical protein